jgi:hypothetical protein
MGALRSALRLRTGLRARPEEADRVQAPCRVVNTGRIMRGTQRRRQQYSTGWGHPVDSCPTPDRGWVRARSRMGKHIDGRHLGCVGTRLSSRSGAGSGPGAGGRSRKRSPSQAGSRARQENSGSLVSPTLYRRGTFGTPAVRQVISGARWISRKQVRPVSSTWAHVSTCVPGNAGFSSRQSSELHDGRCPSRSGRGEAPVASNRGGRRRDSESVQAPDP